MFATSATISAMRSFLCLKKCALTASPSGQAAGPITGILRHKDELQNNLSGLTVIAGRLRVSRSAISSGDGAPHSLNDCAKFPRSAWMLFARAPSLATRGVVEANAGGGGYRTHRHLMPVDAQNQRKTEDDCTILKILKHLKRRPITTLVLMTKHSQLPSQLPSQVPSRV